MTAEEIEEVMRKARKIVHDGGDELREQVGYSGRGMFGKTAPVAFSTVYGPLSSEGRRLIGLGPHGLHHDNLGHDWVYYST